MRSDQASCSALLLSLSVLAFVGGCDALQRDDAKPAAVDEGEENDEEKDRERGGEARNKDGEKPAADDSDGASLSGTVTFSVDGEAKSFDYIPKSKAVLTSITTNFIAKPDAASQEKLSVNLAHFDPRKAELPITIELDLKKQMQSKDPMAAATAPKPLVAYEKPDGTRYAGYVTIRIESWKDARLGGTIDDVELAAAEPEDGKPIKLSNAKFSVQLR